MPIPSVLDDPEIAAWVREGVARGAVAVGGAPYRATDPVAATRASPELSAELGIGLALHVDESDEPGLDTPAPPASAVPECLRPERDTTLQIIDMAPPPST